MKSIYEKLCDGGGEQLTDAELVDGLKSFSAVESALHSFGPHFFFAAKAISSARADLQYFAGLRGLKVEE